MDDGIHNMQRADEIAARYDLWPLSTSAQLPREDEGTPANRRDSTLRVPTAQHQRVDAALNFVDRRSLYDPSHHEPDEARNKWRLEEIWWKRTAAEVQQHFWCGAGIRSFKEPARWAYICDKAFCDLRRYTRNWDAFEYGQHVLLVWSLLLLLDPSQAVPARCAEASSWFVEQLVHKDHHVSRHAPPATLGRAWDFFSSVLLCGPPSLRVIRPNSRGTSLFEEQILGLQRAMLTYLDLGQHDEQHVQAEGTTSNSLANETTSLASHIISKVYAYRPESREHIRTELGKILIRSGSEFKSRQSRRTAWTEAILQLMVHIIQAHSAPSLPQHDKRDTPSASLASATAASAPPTTEWLASCVLELVLPQWQETRILDESYIMSLLQQLSQSPRISRHPASHTIYEAIVLVLADRIVPRTGGSKHQFSSEDSCISVRLLAHIGVALVDRGIHVEKELDRRAIYTGRATKGRLCSNAKAFARWRIGYISLVNSYHGPKETSNAQIPKESSGAVVRKHRSLSLSELETDSCLRQIIKSVQRAHAALPSMIRAESFRGIGELLDTIMTSHSLRPQFDISQSLLGAFDFRDEVCNAWLDLATLLCVWDRAWIRDIVARVSHMTMCRQGATQRRALDWLMQRLFDSPSDGETLLPALQHACLNSSMTWTHSSIFKIFMDLLKPEQMAPVESTIGVQSTVCNMDQRAQHVFQFWNEVVRREVEKSTGQNAASVCETVVPPGLLRPDVVKMIWLRTQAHVFNARQDTVCAAIDLLALLARFDAAYAPSLLCTLIVGNSDPLTTISQHAFDVLDAYLAAREQGELTDLIMQSCVEIGSQMWRYHQDAKEQPRRHADVTDFTYIDLCWHKLYRYGGWAAISTLSRALLDAVWLSSSTAVQRESNHALQIVVQCLTRFSYPDIAAVREVVGVMRGLIDRVIDDESVSQLSTPPHRSASIELVAAAAQALCERYELSPQPISGVTYTDGVNATLGGQSYGKRAAQQPTQSMNTPPEQSNAYNSSTLESEAVSAPSKALNDDVARPQIGTHNGIILQHSHKSTVIDTDADATEAAITTSQEAPLPNPLAMPPTPTSQIVAIVDQGEEVCCSETLLPTMRRTRSRRKRASSGAMNEKVQKAKNPRRSLRLQQRQMS